MMLFTTFFYFQKIKLFDFKVEEVFLLLMNLDCLKILYNDNNENVETVKVIHLE